LQYSEQLPLLDSVDLRRTNVTDEVVRFLSRYPKLSYVDLVGTNVSNYALESLRAEHPKASTPCRGLARTKPNEWLAVQFAMLIESSGLVATLDAANSL
jgi:hypothetical protein